MAYTIKRVLAQVRVPVRLGDLANNTLRQGIGIDVLRRKRDVNLSKLAEKAGLSLNNPPTLINIVVRKNDRAQLAALTRIQEQRETEKDRPTVPLLEILENAGIAEIGTTQLSLVDLFHSFQASSGRAGLFRALSETDRADLFDALGYKSRAGLFRALNNTGRAGLYKVLNKTDRAGLYKVLNKTDRADLFRALDYTGRIDLIRTLDSKGRAVLKDALEGDSNLILALMIILEKIGFQQSQNRNSGND